MTMTQKKYKVFVKESNSNVNRSVNSYDTLSKAIRFAQNMWYAGHTSYIKDTEKNRVIRRYPKY